MKNSKSKEQEVERNAAIILVIGTSSAGKSVLINKIKALDELRPEGERINWDENGVDMEGPRQWAALDPAREDSQFKSLLTHTVNEDGNRGKFTQSEVDGLILNGTLLVGDAKISLSDKGVDIGKFRQSLSTEDQSKYTEESILKLQNLTENYHSLYEDTVERVSNVKVMEAIFARAVENSKKGIPSLLDVVPWDYYDVMGKFKEYTSSHGLSNVSSVVVAHCDIAQLTEHMDQRNAKADVEERRDTTTPFKQYADMYQTCKEGEDGIGSFTVQNVVDAVEKFGKKSDSKELKQLEPGFLPQEVQDLLTKLEVPAEEWSLLDKPIKVTTREAYSSYDLLCQTDEKSGIGITSTIAIDDIVKDIDGIVLNIESNKMKKLEAKEKQPQVQAGNLNAVEAARNFKDAPEIIERYTVFNPRNVYRSASEVLELHDATGADIMPRGNAVNPGDIIGVGLICFRPERIAKQLTVASVNMQAKIDEESFPRIVDDVFGNYVAKEMASVVPQVNQMRLEIERNVEEASKELQGNPDINTDGNEVLTKVKEARDKIRQKAGGTIPPVSEEFINNTAAKYATDLIYNGSPEIFKLVEDAVARGMEQAAKEGKYELLSGHQNNERVAIVVAGGPASGKTQATEMALHSLVDSRDVMAFSTDQLRTLVSPGETGGPAFTDLEANLVFRQIIGKMDRAMKSDVAPTILSEGTSLNPGAINHLLTGGAQVHASLISIPAEVALERAGKRAASDKAADQGRSYSDEYLLGLHKQDGTALPNITNQLQGKNVQLSIFDNNVPRGQSPELIGRMNLQTMEMEIYNVQKLAELEQKGKIDPTQSKDQGMYAADDKLPENNISFLTDALKKFSVTFRDGEMGEEYAALKPGEKLTITNQALFDSKQQNPYDKALTSPLLEEAKKAEQEQKSGDSWAKKLGLEDKAEKPRSFLEAAQAGKYGNIGSKGEAHEL